MKRSPLRAAEPTGGRRVHLGRERRIELTSRAWCAVLVALVGAASSAGARTTVVPDDFPTIQAAVESIPIKAPVETLLVRGGSYPERVLIRYRQVVIQAIPALDGSGRVPEIAEMVADYHGCAFFGLHFTGPVTASWSTGDPFLFADCRFDRGLDGRGRDMPAIRLTRCVLFHRVALYPRVVTVDSCTIYGPLSSFARDSTFILDNRFENATPFAVHIDSERSLVARNQVRGGAGFLAYPRSSEVRFEDNDIEGCQGWGIDIQTQGSPPSHLERNRVVRCGSGIRIQGRTTVRGNLVRDCRGPGIDIDQMNGAGIVEDNVVGRCDVAGIRLENPFAWLTKSTVSVRNNTVYACNGPGIEIASLPGSTIANNLVHATGGLSALDDTQPLDISHNDWFPAMGAPDAPTDLSVDPQFCDLSADDVRLRSDSPLLDVPGAGRIGALGQGCEAPMVAMGFEVWPRILQPTARARWLTVWLEPPSPFTVAEIDVATVRVNDVLVATGSATAGDQDRDGIPDLQLRLDRAALERTLGRGEEVSVGVTGRIGRRSFTGIDLIRVLRHGGPRSSVPRGMPRVLSIQTPPTLATGSLRAAFTLIDESPARLDVLDVAGRVIVSRDVGERGPGEHSLEFGGGVRLAQGIYFLRLTQGDNEARTRLIVLM